MRNISICLFSHTHCTWHTRCTVLRFKRGLVDGHVAFVILQALIALNLRMSVQWGRGGEEEEEGGKLMQPSARVKRPPPNYFDQGNR